MKIKFIANNWLPKLLKVDAIMLYPFILSAHYPIPHWIVKHEMTHVAQIRRIGFMQFYIKYLMEYLKNRLAGQPHFTAYENISYEIEARAMENLPLTASEYTEVYV